MGELINYGKWIEAIMAERGVMLPDAIRIAHKAAPGARRAWERASESERAGAIVPPVPAAGSATSGGESVSQQTVISGDYFAEVAKVAKERGVKRTEAQRVVLREKPHLWKQMIRAANPHKNEEELFGEVK